MNRTLWESAALSLLGGAALLLSATIGFAQAHATPTTVTDKKQHRETIIDPSAAKLGLTVDQLTTALKQAHKDLGGNQGASPLAKLAHQELTVAATALGIADVKTLRQELAGHHADGCSP